MGSAVNERSGTTARMGKKKPTGGKHKTPRVNVGVPGEWHAVMRKLAAAGKQPVLWFLIDLTAKAAAEAGMEHPPFPWEDPEGED